MDALIGRLFEMRFTLVNSSLISGRSILEQYNLTIERQLSRSMLLRVAYVGTQAHRLLASHDQNPGNIQTCIGLANLANLNANNVLSAPLGNGGTPTSCGTSGSESEYFIPPGTASPRTQLCPLCRPSLLRYQASTVLVLCCLTAERPVEILRVLAEWWGKTE